jgi:6-phosphogluconolactonase
MSIHQFKYPDPLGAAKACAHNICAELQVALAGDAGATLAISGGSTPKLMFAEMAKQPFDWSRVHLFWVDERAVPPTGDQSNFKLADESFIQPAHFPRRNVHRIQGELRPEAAAERYSAEIGEYFGLGPGEMPHFDVIHRGIGPDCHTASLFPGEPLIEDREHLAAAVYVEKLKSWRITMLPGILLNARHTVMLVCGEDKQKAVRQIFEEPYEPLKYPAQLTSHGGRSVTWFLDDAAARLMP